MPDRKNRNSPYMKVAAKKQIEAYFPADHEQQHIYRLIRRLKHVGDPEMNADLDCDLQITFFGQLIALRDQDGPLGKKCVEIIAVFHNIWNAYVVLEVLPTWHKYQIPERKTTKLYKVFEPIAEQPQPNVIDIIPFD